MLLKEFENAQVEKLKAQKKDVNFNFAVGDTVKVHYKITEGKTTRIQIFEGVVIAKSKSTSNINATLRTTSGRSVHGTESPFSLEGTTSAKNVVLGDNLYFTNPRMVASSINETNEMAGAKSMFVNLTISSSNANLSPVIDLKRVRYETFLLITEYNYPESFLDIDLIKRQSYVDDTYKYYKEKYNLDIIKYNIYCENPLHQNK